MINNYNKKRSKMQMKLPEQSELERQKLTFYRLVNFILSVGILASAVYGISLVVGAII